jgi:hypothetical protein
MAAAREIVSVEDGEGLAGFLLTESEALHVLFFFATWDEASKPGGPLHAVLSRLAELHPGVLFGKVRMRVALFLEAVTLAAGRTCGPMHGLTRSPFPHTCR